VTGIPDKLL